MNHLFAWAFAMLVWTSPCVAFIAANTSWFNNKQILSSLVLSCVLGALTALGFSLVPESGNAWIGGLIFSIASERLIASFAKKISVRIGLIFLVSACFYGAYAAIGFLGLNILLIIYCLFSLWDLHKNLRKPKRAAPNPAAPASKEIKYSTTNPLGRLARTPSIYLFFLESMHSLSALKALYQHGNSDLPEYLEKNGFKIFPHAFSNEFGTTYSLNTMLNMNAEGYIPSKQAPVVFQWLKANGYELRLYDCAMYTFSHYVPFVDYFNYAIPSWIKFLQAWFLPFLAQSAVFNIITKNTDFFTAEANYARVLSDFRTSPKNEKPVFSIFRFGAQHTHSTYALYEREKFRELYIRLYDKAVQDVMEISGIIQKQDPEAVIVIMGDHGASSYHGSWRGAKSANENILANGIEPALVTRDLTEILLAIRMPEVQDLPTQVPITAANLFRLLFSRLGASGLTPSPDNAWLRDPNLANPLLILENGQLLKDWVEWTPEYRLERKCPEEVTTADEAKEIAILMRNAGKFDEARKFLEMAIGRIGFHPSLAYYLAQFYLTLGRPKDAMSLLEGHFMENCYLFTTWVLAINFLGNHQQALTILDLYRDQIPMLNYELVFLWLKLCARDLEGALPILKIRAEREYEEIWKKDNAIVEYARCLSAMERQPEALRMLENFIAAYTRRENAIPHSMLMATLLSLQNGRYEAVLEWFSRIEVYEGKPWPAQMYLWQAGALEQLDKVEQAENLLGKMMKKCPPVPYLHAQLGLFAIRHHIETPELELVKKHAHELLREYQEQTPFIDQEFIKSRYGTLLEKSGQSPLEFFAYYNRFLSLDPNEFFNSVYYNLVNDDVYKKGYDPVLHFLACSPYENRNPSMKFNLQAYMARHPLEDWSSQNPLMHYLLSR